MMNDYKEWLLSKLPSLVPCQNTQINSGTYDFSVNFGTSSEKTNPLNIEFRSKKGNTEAAEETFCFSVSGGVPELQFIRRFRNTPFYLSSLVNDDYSIYIVDFYEWYPELAIYRIIYFPTVETEQTLEVNLPKTFTSLDQNVYKSENSFFAYSGPADKEAAGFQLKLPVCKTDTHEQVYIFSLSENKISTDTLSINTLLTRLNHLISEAEKNHILNDIRIQDKKSQHAIDDFWSRQKGFNPDRSLNRSLYDVKITDDNIFLWTTELAEYMGWDNLFDSKIAKNIQTLRRELKKGDDYFVKSYLENDITSDELINSLQSWWDQYSLPLYHEKFIKDLETNPSLLFTIFLLALQLQLPWSADLYHLCNQFYDKPQIALFAFLYQIIMVSKGRKGELRIAPGSMSKGNVKILKRGDVSCQYTRFGDIHYTSVKRNTLEIVRIDKEVIVNLDKTYQNILINPYITALNLNRLRKNQISIEIDKRLYQVPLVWKKAELFIPGCRIRWIFKKDRFQFTCQPDKNCKSLKIEDNEIIISGTKKIKYYHPLDKSENTAVLRLLDASGRSFILDHDLPENQCQLFGWVQDQYGIFCDHFNIRFNSHQIPCKVQRSGKIKQVFGISSNIDSIRIGTRKSLHPVHIGRIKNRHFSNLLRYSHRTGKSILLIIVDDQLGLRKMDIQKSFMKCLGFVPFITYKSELKNKFRIPLSMYIEKSGNRIKSEKNSPNLNTSPLSIHYPEGIQNLFKILSEDKNY